MMICPDLDFPMAGELSSFRASAAGRLAHSSSGFEVGMRSFSFESAPISDLGAGVSQHYAYKALQSVAGFFIC